MKILVKKDPTSIIYRTTCSKCYSKLEFDRNDIEIGFYLEYIICPVCKRLISNYQFRKKNILDKIIEYIFNKNRE
jgi:hypothetical protein